MPSTANRCPVCLLPKKGGRRCAYHVTQTRRGLSEDFLRESSAKTIERNQVIQIVAEAVDEARSRKEYHRAYYQANKVKRRKQRLESKRSRKILTIHSYLIKQLCDAVDIGRMTTGW